MASLTVSTLLLENSILKLQKNCHLANSQLCCNCIFMFLLLMKIIAFVYLCLINIVSVYCLYTGEDVLS